MNIHSIRGIRTPDPSNKTASELRLKPHGHRVKYLCPHSIGSNNGTTKTVKTHVFLGQRAVAVNSLDTRLDLAIASLLKH
jgi:hypothetical protein